MPLFQKSSLTWIVEFKNICCNVPKKNVGAILWLISHLLTNSHSCRKAHTINGMTHSVRSRMHKSHKFITKHHCIKYTWYYSWCYEEKHDKPATYVYVSILRFVGKLLHDLLLNSVSHMFWANRYHGGFLGVVHLSPLCLCKATCQLECLLLNHRPIHQPAVPRLNLATSRESYESLENQHTYVLGHPT